MGSENLPDIKDIPVVILCGGKGTRIREISDLVPKPMLRIGGQPIVWHIMMTYAHHGFRRFILCLGYKGEQFRDYFLNYQAMTRDVTLDFQSNGDPPVVDFNHDQAFSPNWSVTLVDTGPDTMTGGRVARVARYLDKDLFMLTYGDGLGDIDIPATIQTHIRSRATVTVTGVRPPSRFGKIDLDGDRIVRFTEKPQTETGYISGGYMVCDRAFVDDYLSPDEGCILEVNGLSPAAADGGMYVHRHDGFWMPMDNSTEYDRLNHMWDRDRAPWKVW